jgi:carboxypeptidase C (cathepsin A)
MYSKRLAILSVAIAALLAGASQAQDVPARPEKGSPPANPELTVLPADKRSVTNHVITVDGRQLAYIASAGVLTIAPDDPLPEARIFYISYELEGAQKADRPITFAFNGGPGTASAYLHLGALGPKRILLNDDGSVPPPPPQFADNPLTWLAFTDLVFIDPVGTGYSRGAPGKDGKPDNKPFYGTRPDILTLGRAVRLYLARNDRWQSPKFLVGESYGGFRVAALAEILQSEFGIALNGGIMISPVIDTAFAWGRGLRDQPLPWALELPTYAAIALYHGRSRLPKPAGPIDRTTLADVEAWALDGYLPDLAQGETLKGPAAEAFIDKLAGYTGLAPDLIRRRHGQITAQEFAKNLLSGTARALNLYDGANTFIDPDPGDPGPAPWHLSLAAFNAALLPTINGYIRGELKFETDLTYFLDNDEVERQWSWHQKGTEQGYVSGFESLKNGVTLNPHFKVMVAHGLFDLVTPYFGSVYLVNQMRLDGAVRPNVEIKTYEGGHMMYIHQAARESLFHDAAAFYAAAASASTH